MPIILTGSSSHTFDFVDPADGVTKTITVQKGEDIEPLNLSPVHLAKLLRARVVDPYDAQRYIDMYTQTEVSPAASPTYTAGVIGTRRPVVQPKAQPSPRMSVDDLNARLAKAAEEEANENAAKADAEAAQAMEATRADESASTEGVRDQLVALAAQHGISHHPLLGEAKLRKLLVEKGVEVPE